MKFRASFIVVAITAIVLFGVAIAVSAVGGDPQTFFTSNINSTGTSQNPTAMEQALLDEIDAATTSIDAAI